VVCYLDDILIYWANEMEHEEHFGKVLQRLRESGLNQTAEMCQFRVLEVGFVIFITNADGIGMEYHRIATIDDWSTV